MKILLLDSGLGLVPFLKEIIMQNKENTYYFFMDYEFFPYGNKKNFQLKKRLKELLNMFESLKIDLLLICCNTLSNIYMRYKLKTSYKVKTILSLNLKYLKNKYILVTPNLKKSFKNNSRFVECNLAQSIEYNDIGKLIGEIKSFSFDKGVILGCTHYPLAKNLFKHYCNFDVISYESLFINKLISDKEMKFYGRDYEIGILSKYFPNISIVRYSLS